MTIKIEKNVPAPPARYAGRTDDFPVEKLAVGDSFVISLNGRKSWAFVFTKIQYLQNKHNIKLISRRLIDDETKRRIWRVA